MTPAVLLLSEIRLFLPQMAVLGLFVRPRSPPKTQPCHYPYADVNFDADDVFDAVFGA